MFSIGIKYFLAYYKYTLGKLIQYFPVSSMCDNAEDSLLASVTDVPARSRQTGRDAEETRCVVCVCNIVPQRYVILTNCCRFIDINHDQYLVTCSEPYSDSNRLK